MLRSAPATWAGNPLGTYAESVGRVTTVTRGIIDQKLLTRLQLASPVRVADLTSREILGGWHLDAEIWAGADYDGCQRWAAALHLGGFAGIWYPTRHSVDGVLHALALFGKPGLDPSAFVHVASGPIPDDLVDEAEKTFGIAVLPATALP